MASTFSLRSLASPAISFPTSSLSRGLAALTTCILPQSSRATVLSQQPPSSRLFSTTPAHQKRQHVEKKDPKIVAFLQGLSATAVKRVPAPLRMARNRHLRHWTIHRAWLLFRRKQQEARERELMQLYQSMHNACEELRQTEGPGTRPEGYLYRVAMEKKGVYGLRGVPIEYARPLTETPAREAWNHGWKR